MKTLYFDCSMGAAGDMLSAALVISDVCAACLLWDDSAEHDEGCKERFL